MTKKTQKLAVRLLRDELEPEDALRAGATLRDWDRVEGARIALGTLGNPDGPKWSRFLALSEAEKGELLNYTAFGLIFLRVEERWFAVSFGLGHVKLDPAKFEHDFGLRVVLNSVDPKQLKSADLRTPDENTLTRRSQTSRGSDQTAFSIDAERDIVRGLAGTPKDPTFASRVAGSDSLIITREMDLADLATVCSDVLAMYNKTDYRSDFGWIDQIEHIRGVALVADLNEKASALVEEALKTGNTEGLHLAFPVIYDPEKTNQLQYKGFRSQNIYPDLDIEGYLDALKERGFSSCDVKALQAHTVHEVDDEHRDCGGKWKIFDCLVCEVKHDGKTYVLSGGRWYKIDVSLAQEVEDFFDAIDKVKMPDALPDETEEKYNARLKADVDELLCLDRKLVKPTGATSPIEVCDFLTKDSRLIHVKDKTSSSRLSHLFSQGTVSGRVLILDGPARDKARTEITAVQSDTGQSGFEDVICDSAGAFSSSDFTVVYAVIAASADPKLPFFSLVSFRQAVRELTALGYKTAFSWITKPPATAEKKKRKGSKGSSDEETDAEGSEE